MGTTSFICTIGPKTLDKKWLDALHGAGMNIARVNGAHGTLDDVRKMINRLKKDLPKGVAILLDLPGNKIRTDNIKEPIPLKAGQEFVLKPNMVTYRAFYRALKPGHRISAADGSIQLEVTAIKGEDIHTKVLVGGPLATRKGVNVRGIHGAIPFDFERDINLLNIAIETGIDYIGLSFVREGEHVRRMQAQLVGTEVKLVAKVETAESLKDLDVILATADKIMIDRGDLEAEVGRENIPLAQKMILRRAREAGVDAVVASQFLCSMLDKPLPFMAEVSDIANAVLDGAAILMLSEETAIGEYPVECIDTMKTVSRTIERHMERDLDALILSAGPSTGFGALTDNKPKTMLDVGGTTIVQHQLENLALAGIESESTHVITGYNYRQIEHYLESGGFRGKFIYNPWYQDTNMAASVWMARMTDRNYILVYGDIVFDPTLLEDLIATDGDIVLVVDRQADLDPEAEKVVIEKGRVRKASKKVPADAANGEFIGLAKLSRRGAKKLWNELDLLMREGNRMSFLSDVFQSLAEKGEPITVCETRGKPWNDNDTLADLGVSREKIFPLIRSGRAGNGSKKERAKR